MTDVVFECSFLSEIHRVKSVLLEALYRIKLRFPALSRNDESDLRLIFSELLYNAVIHGNKLDRNKSVYICVEATICSICCTISDEGSGFDHKRLSESFSVRDNLESEHGRGIRLAIALTDKFSFNNAGNEIIFHKKVVLTSYE